MSTPTRSFSELPFFWLCDNIVRYDKFEQEEQKLKKIVIILVSTAFALTALLVSISNSGAPLAVKTASAHPTDYMAPLRQAKIVSRSRQRQMLTMREAEQAAAKAKTLKLARIKAEQARKRALAVRHAAYVAQATQRRIMLERSRRPKVVTIKSSGGSHPGGDAACIRKYESGGNYNAENPSSSASGAYQFLDTTWRAITGLSGRAKDYPASVQDAAFAKLWAGGHGRGQWVTSNRC